MARSIRPRVSLNRRKLVTCFLHEVLSQQRFRDFYEGVFVEWIQDHQSISEDKIAEEVDAVAGDFFDKIIESCTKKTDTEDA